MNPNIYPIDVARSKSGRELVDDFREMLTRFSRVEAAQKAMEQQKDTAWGSLTTRSGNGDGVATLNNDTVTVLPAVGATADVVWDSGGDVFRTDMLVTAVSGRAVTLSGGSGANLPTQGTTVRVVHYATMAEVFRFVGDVSPDADTPADGGVAYRAFGEITSMLANSAALRQASARFRQ